MVINHQGLTDDHCQSCDNILVAWEVTKQDHSPLVKVGMVHHHLPEECYHLCLDNRLVMVIHQFQWPVYLHKIHLGSVDTCSH